jgi:hypothetical protein
MTYQRFLEMESRKHPLVRACIRLHSIQPPSGGIFELALQSEENREEHTYNGTNPATLVMKNTGAAVNWLHVHPIETVDETDSSSDGDDCM